MELTIRQEKILHLIKENSPISGEEIAQNLGLTRSALRTDFSILRKMALISARQNYGYCYIGGESKHKVGQVMGEPKKVDSKSSVYETIVYMFENDIGSVFITEDRKSTRLNSSHANISYAVFCLKKKTHLHS